MFKGSEIFTTDEFCWDKSMLTFSKFASDLNGRSFMNNIHYKHDGKYLTKGFIFKSSKTGKEIPMRFMGYTKQGQDIVSWVFQPYFNDHQFEVVIFND